MVSVSNGNGWVTIVSDELLMRHDLCERFSISIDDTRHQNKRRNKNHRKYVYSTDITVLEFIHHEQYLLETFEMEGIVFVIYKHFSPVNQK